jgi:hypothetical protein
LFFVGLFVLGLGLMAGGLVQDLFMDGFGFEPSASSSGDPRQLPRIMEVAGLILAFGAIYGAATWRFLKQRKAEKNQA